jgi:hypothetical protein
VVCVFVCVCVCLSVSEVWWLDVSASVVTKLQAGIPTFLFPAQARVFSSQKS